AFGIVDPLASGFGTASLELLLAEHGSGALRLHLRQTLLIQGDIQRGTVFLGLLATDTLQRHDQERQGDQLHKAGIDRKIDHESFLAGRVPRRPRSSGGISVATGEDANGRRRRTITSNSPMPPSSSAAGLNDSRKDRASRGG